MTTLEKLNERIKALETWANREALRRGTLGYIAERMIAEQLAEMSPERSDRILAELANPYRVVRSITGIDSDNERLKASRHSVGGVEPSATGVGETRGAAGPGADGLQPPGS